MLKKLGEHHAEEIAITWKTCSATPERKIYFFTYLIKHYHSVGLFTKSETGEVSGSPIGWCLQYADGNLGHLFVQKNHRRKGLAKLLAQYMCIRIVEDGEIPIAFVKKDNHCAASLFVSLGFVKSGECIPLICCSKI